MSYEIRHYRSGRKIKAVKGWSPSAGLIQLLRDSGDHQLADDLSSAETSVTEVGDFDNTIEPARPHKTRLRGIGDVIAVVVKAVGVKPCSGCKKRQSLANKIIPFKKGSLDEA